MTHLFPIIILCGGLGTRVQSHGAPKSLIRFNQKPFISHQMKLLDKKGFDDLILCTGYQSDEIMKHSVSAWININIDEIKFSNEETPLGTGGAIKNIAYLPENFFVIYGDTYANINYRQMQRKFLKSNKMCMMGVYKNNNQLDKSNVKIIDKDTLLYKKNNAPDDYIFIDYGVSIFNRKSFIGFVDDAFPLSYIQEKLSRKNEISPYIIKDRFYEIGSPEGIEDFKKFVKKEKL